MPKIGAWQDMTSDALWARLVSQVCVMGSARGMESLQENPKSLAAFQADTSLRAVERHKYEVNSLEYVLRGYGATRFPAKAASTLLALRSNKQVVRGRRVVLLDGIDAFYGAQDIRNELMRRCTLFGMKSASDFMIECGLADDVVALDTRLVSVFSKHFGYNLKASQLQSNPQAYRSVEEALERFCKQESVTLAELDRLLFKFSSISVIAHLLTSTRSTKR
ncbi:hypothetical protein BG60_35830 [Caballeronia zhejiangensis]|uniref:Uncharacterized protein n=1 Tax=Caballeronia zhejiangensis TaxID=871203 RepID=A0A656QA62_9BURK|nr:hypothetical protein BG58_41720 [Caballeronia jiangsuensis]KDR24685.1 hypothetical protein BG60_35830 [Caballeronia zhejiangensis]